MKLDRHFHHLTEIAQVPGESNFPARFVHLFSFAFCSGTTRGSAHAALPAGLERPYGALASNLGQQCARRVPCLLYYLWPQGAIMRTDSERSRRPGTAGAPAKQRGEGNEDSTNVGAFALDVADPIDPQHHTAPEVLVGAALKGPQQCQDGLGHPWTLTLN